MTLKSAGPMHPQQCPTCGGEFWVLTSLLNTKKHCSYKCFTRSKGQRPKRRIIRNPSGKCVECGGPSAKMHYWCSSKCSIKWRNAMKRAQEDIAFEDQS